MISESNIQYKGIDGIPHCVFGTTTPETGAWRIYKPVINLKKCVKCRMCWLYCPESAIHLDKNDKPHIDYEICKGCMICANACPVKCIGKERDLHSLPKKGKLKRKDGD